MAAERLVSRGAKIRGEEGAWEIGPQAEAQPKGEGNDLHKTNTV